MTATDSFVKKPIYGRLGENISVVKNGETVLVGETFEDQPDDLPNYYPL
jgi:glutathionylspermidine synthase